MSAIPSDLKADEVIGRARGHFKVMFQVSDDGDSRGFRLAGNEAIVDPDSDDDKVVGIFINVIIDAGVGSRSSEPKRDEERVEFLVPFSRSLLESIEWLEKAADIVLLSRLNESLRLAHVQFLIEFSIEKRSFDI